MKYDVFISYSRQDKSIVQSIIRIFQDEGISYCIDVDSISSGDQFASVLYESIENSGCVLFVSSENSNASQWVDGEIAVARELGKRIIPFKVDDTPYSKKIAIYISALDAVNYFADNKSATDSLVKSIKSNSSADVGTPAERSKEPNRKYFYYWFVVLCLILACCILIVYHLFNGDNRSDYQKESQLEARMDTTSSSVVDTVAVVGVTDTLNHSAALQENNDSSKRYSISGKTLRIKIGNIEYNLKKVPSGTFKIGATEEQSDYCKADEKPVTKLNMSSFFIGATEITEAFWEAVMSHPDSDVSNLPKTSISYNDCLQFIERLSVLTGLTIKLPTEAQWEYAAREAAIDNSTIFSGSSDLSCCGWYSGNSTSPQAVALKNPNSLGLYDMSGNVAEWCCSWYGNYTSLSAKDPMGALYGDEMIIRGGSFLSEENGCRNSARDKMTPETTAEHIGFRIICKL